MRFRSKDKEASGSGGLDEKLYILNHEPHLGRRALDRKACQIEYLLENPITERKISLNVCEASLRNSLEVAT